MRILHTGDIHFDDSKVLPDIIKCTDFLVDTAIKENPDVIVVAGDLWNSGVQLGSPASLAGISFVKRLADIAPTVVISGTTSHDAPGSIIALKGLRTIYPLHVTDKPQQVILRNNVFLTEWIEADLYDKVHPVKAVISCLPTITKANLIPTLSGSVTETSRATIDTVRDMLQGWGVINEQARKADIPTILVGHGTVTGSMLSTGQTLVGHDLEYTTGDLLLAKCNLYCLGHIHKQQQFGDIVYSGSITRLNHGEVEPKGFFIHEIEKAAEEYGPVHTYSQFIETPARTMRTFRPEGLPDVAIVADVTEGELVRICYTVSENDTHKVDEEAIRKAAIEKGAADVKIEKTIIPMSKVRAEGISKETSVYGKLEKWGSLNGIEVERLKDKLEKLERFEVENIVEALYSKEVAA